jgi:hypothetical protein
MWRCVQNSAVGIESIMYFGECWDSIKATDYCILNEEWSQTSSIL